MARVAAVLVYNHIPKISKRLEPAAAEIVDETLFVIEGTAKINVPVDTGALRASIQTEKEKPTSGSVYTNMEYAWFVEAGTVNMPPQPYMIPAAEQARSGFLAKMSALESRLG